MNRNFFLAFTYMNKKEKKMHNKNLCRQGDRNLVIDFRRVNLKQKAHANFPV